MRKIAVMACLLVLVAACAGGSKTEAPATDAPATLPANFDARTVTPEMVATMPRNQARAAIDAMLDQFILQADSQCIGQAVGHWCINQRYVAGFDPLGQFAENCEVNGLGSEYRLCLIIAAETAPMFAAAGKDPRTEIDWSNVDDMNNAGRRTFMGAVLPKCGEDRECIIQLMAQRLGLSRYVTEACQEPERFLDRLTCITDSISVTVYRRALDVTASQGS